MIKLVNDWLGARKLKQGLLASIKLTPPGKAVAVDLSDKNIPQEIIARAIHELLTEHPEFDVVDFGKKLTLMRKRDVRANTEKESYDDLHHKLQILNRENIGQAGDLLPDHEYRNGVPEDFNGDEETVERLLSAPGSLGLGPVKGRLLDEHGRVIPGRIRGKS